MGGHYFGNFKLYRYSYFFILPNFYYFVVCSTPVNYLGAFEFTTLHFFGFSYLVELVFFPLYCKEKELQCDSHVIKYKHNYYK